MRYGLAVAEVDTADIHRFSVRVVGEIAHSRAAGTVVCGHIGQILDAVIGAAVVDMEFVVVKITACELGAGFAGAGVVVMQRALGGNLEQLNVIFGGLGAGRHGVFVHGDKIALVKGRCRGGLYVVGNALDAVFCHIDTEGAADFRAA